MIMLLSLSHAHSQTPALTCPSPPPFSNACAGSRAGQHHHHTRVCSAGAVDGAGQVQAAPYHVFGAGTDVNMLGEDDVFSPHTTAALMAEFG